jgi:hypothetical protein
VGHATVPRRLRGVRQADVADGGTIVDGTRLPLLTWFRAAPMVPSNKSGVSAKVLQRDFGIAVERKGFGKNSKRWKLGRTRIRVVPDVKAKTLLDFVEDTCETEASAAQNP